MKSKLFCIVHIKQLKINPPTAAVRFLRPNPRSYRFRAGNAVPQFGAELRGVFCSSTFGHVETIRNSSARDGRNVTASFFLNWIKFKRRWKESSIKSADDIQYIWKQLVCIYFRTCWFRAFAFFGQVVSYSRIKKKRSNQIRTNKKEDVGLYGIDDE